MPFAPSASDRSALLSPLFPLRALRFSFVYSILKTYLLSALKTLYEKQLNN
jgi:hypothetical protein